VRHLVHFLLQIRLLFFRCSQVAAKVRENSVSVILSGVQRSRRIP
jgi:hypothetical protein